MTTDPDERPDRPAGAVVREEAHISVVEEQLAIGRRRVDGATVTVRTTPRADTVEVCEPVLREEVTVERVPVGAVIDAMPPVREDGNLTVIPVVEERVRVVRELVLVEEIHLRRTRREHVHAETLTLRRTEVEVSRDEGPAPSG
ncbi:DUF2382 domain-containing protein [Erythrobacteraceae bacterium CFH 75059]|uniref:DUF2382 domain-containing protein n=1 Tax=Qipengyuania thermophila TaxID=2509361 RepID=UPI00102146C2|nr:DUF2382 domain-containing protein [Qipengyuania thermophila]TCD06855.1 DUF2382 domain-containing protein [Erythrobacteraceae bacterium CFH 75059]